MNLFVMLKTKIFDKNKKIILEVSILSLLILVGIFLRCWHFSDWLIFQSDQSRDALIVHQAVQEGVDKLPLIGPQARSSSLHLGPIFYYFQYISGKIFGPLPESFAYPDLFFGLLTLPLLYLLLKKFVSQWIALGLVGIASVSVFLVTFSRFAWNPNSLPFFTTLFAWFFIQVLEKDNWRLWYLAGSALCLGIIFQLHFIAALSLILALVLFLIISRPLNWKEFSLCFLIVLAIQTPTIIYELKNQGAVSSVFLETVEEKGTQDDSHGIHEKLFRAYQEQANIFWLIVTGQKNSDLILTRGWSIKCDKECRATLPLTLSSLILFTAFLLIGFWKWKNEKDNPKKQILIFLDFWFLSFFLITTLVAYQISTRFYLGVVPLLFLFLAFSLQWLEKSLPQNFSKYFIFILVLIVLGLNLKATLIYLKGLSLSEKTNKQTHRDLVFETEPKVTLEQLRTMATKVSQHYSNDQEILISGESRYARSLFYLLSNEKKQTTCYRKGSIKETLNQAQAIILRNKNQHQSIPLGTLSLQLIAPDITSPKDLFPLECFHD